ncbi:MAG: E3 binding domain-containing protein, partial [Gammaproteobacteria bacterium]|nr:E3 binding domain-containing protein [Gammaproteobacteria bacterium]
MKIFYLPDLGEGLVEAEIREWYVTVGDVVKIDQPLVSMETAKAVVDVPSPYAGKIITLHGNPNEMIKTGAPLISFETDEITQDKGSVVGKLETSEKKWNEAQAVTSTVRANAPSLKAMPAARVLAKELHIDLTKVTPTGPNGLITVDDVKKCLSHPPKSLSVEIGQMNAKTEILHGVRRTMALAMTQSHHDIVPVTIIEDADISHLAPKTDLTVHLIKAMAAAI